MFFAGGGLSCSEANSMNTKMNSPLNPNLLISKVAPDARRNVGLYLADSINDMLTEIAVTSGRPKSQVVSLLVEAAHAQLEQEAR